MPLAIAVQLWPTPSASPWRSGCASEATHARNSRPLNEVVLLYPTPRADGRDNCGGSNSRRSAKAAGTYIGRKLNPEFVEWLMGVPIGWTELDPSGTDSCPRSPNGSAD
jgi:hypothetical protein